jgi:hypothetical protein
MNTEFSGLANDLNGTMDSILASEFSGLSLNTENSKEAEAVREFIRANHKAMVKLIKDFEGIFPNETGPNVYDHMIKWLSMATNNVKKTITNKIIDSAKANLKANVPKMPKPEKQPKQPKQAKSKTEILKEPLPSPFVHSPQPTPFAFEAPENTATSFHQTSYPDEETLDEQEQ